MKKRHYYLYFFCKCGSLLLLNIFYENIFFTKTRLKYYNVLIFVLFNNYYCQLYDNLFITKCVFIYFLHQCIYLFRRYLLMIFKFTYFLLFFFICCIRSKNIFNLNFIKDFRRSLFSLNHYLSMIIFRFI